jgi:hypothetical protein
MEKVVRIKPRESPISAAGTLGRRRAGHGGVPAPSRAGNLGAPIYRADISTFALDRFSGIP